MSETSQEQQDTQDATPGEEVEVDQSTRVELSYQGTSRLIDEPDQSERLALFTNTQRAPVRVEGRLKEPLVMREALSVLYETVGSDHRRAPRDRSAYLAYKSATSGSGDASLFQAQRDYFDWMRQNDVVGWVLLDPIISSHPDGLSFEVFSKDEGSYARLGISWEALELDGEPDHGTTNIDYSEALYSSIERMRSYRDTTLSIGREAVSVTTGDAPAVIEKKVDVPNSWLRGFLQVQSSATLPHTRVTIAPIDMYNVLRVLRLNADQKKGGRAIRVELVPGERPRLVLEPWEQVIETHGEIYRGRTARVVRVWGRRRLKMIQRMLPFADSIDLHLLGSGLPNFWVMRCGHYSLTLGLTGFRASNWSQALNLDSLLPRTDEVSADLERVVSWLSERWLASADEISEGTEIGRADLRAALQLGCQQGLLMYDLVDNVFRYRPLSDSIDLDDLQFRNERERLAHDLLEGQGGDVKIVSENRMLGLGTQYVGEVAVSADRRAYRCEMTIDEEGRVKRADCTSPFFRKHQLKEGPSAPLIALRMKIAQIAATRAAERGKGNIEHETRTYVKREDKREAVYHVSLDERRLKVRWGDRAMERLRSQNLLFNNVEDARDAYFTRIRELEGKGYMDATMS